MITLYWCPRTRSVRTIWALEEVGVDYGMVEIDIRAENRHEPPEFSAASPLGKVPAIVDSGASGEAKVADSAAIALYLADRYAPGKLAPAPDEPGRGEFLTWLFFTPSVIEPAMVEKFADVKPNPTAYAWGSFDRMIVALETRMQGREWVVGDRFTMADLMLTGSIQFMTMFGILSPSPTLASYKERGMARPAAVRANAKESVA